MRINDVKASMQDVLALQPDEVTKVEFINVPGLKYGDSNLDAVINYQVRRRYAGYVGGVSTMQGTKAGFVFRAVFWTDDCLRGYFLWYGSDEE